jgi:4-hydroxythreonine-4-phosphate dehydrogenase
MPSAPVLKNAAIALTEGEPAGVGPELAIKAWVNRREHNLPYFFYMGDAKFLQTVSPNTPIKIITDPLETNDIFDVALPVLDRPYNHTVVPGQPKVETALQLIENITEAVTLAKNGKIRALVTNPIQKAILYKAGFDFTGHTDFLAHLCALKPDAAIMMLKNPQIRVVPATHHVPLSQVPSLITTDGLVHLGKTVSEDLETYFGIKNPKLAITGLNPHAGEHGTLGTEENTIISPAIVKLKEAGILVDGPFPADTLFTQNVRDRYDVIIAMYHDQALGPMKALDFEHGVNITLGLPIIRTSPDHGTALSLVGTGKASETSLVEAIKTADEMANNHTATNHER